MTRQKSLARNSSAMFKRGRGGGESERLRTLQQAVSRYLRYDAPRSREELEYFGERSQSTEQAVERAGRSASAGEDLLCIYKDDLRRIGTLKGLS